ncbi:hypothetical protein SAMN05443270_3013 [Lacrimispora sphenoides]|uniref:hypothetical protein n=1 Tax=Lacrimispora sphenoides TaxID=29370 RepID=UPI0008C0AD69|nr:hypothetical protein [Lacrimispora sphenoides]SEU08281.1 hypothetical protein SAMN05443270_3013 [Lacrimispora sphenoides]
MFKKIKEYFIARKEYNQAKKALTILLLNQYSDLMELQKQVTLEQQEIIKSMSGFTGNFNPDDMKKFMDNISKVANNPELTSDYYKTISENAHAEKMAELKAVK